MKRHLFGLSLSLACILCLAPGRALAAGPVPAGPLTVALPTITGGFTAEQTPVGDTVGLIFDIVNSNYSTDFTGVGVTVYTNVLIESASPQAMCGGTLTIISNMATLSGATVAAGTQCEVHGITIPVTSVGQLAAVTTNVTSNVGNSLGTASPIAWGIQPPSVYASFSPSHIAEGALSTLTFTLYNPSVNPVALNAVYLSSTLPSGLTVSSGTWSACGGTLTLTAPNVIHLSGSTVSMAGSCQVAMTVLGSESGNYTASAEAWDTTFPSNTASANLTVSGAATHLSVSTADPFVAGAAHSVTITAKDALGNVATGYRGTIHFTSSDPAAILPANYTFTSADDGVHKFTGGLTLKTSGSRWVRATDVATASIVGAQTVTVDPGAAKTLAVVTVTPWAAGAGHTVTITARDACGNIATGYLGTIHLTSTDAHAVLPSDYKFVAGDLGVHKFVVTLKTAGSMSITATDKTTSTIKGTQSGIVVTPGVARTFTLVGAVPWLAGASHSVTVTARDAYGNVAKSYTGTVHLTSSDSAAVLPGDYTFIAADAGVHKLTVKLKTAGSRWVRATDTHTASIIGSVTITVS